VQPQATADRENHCRDPSGHCSGHALPKIQINPGATPKLTKSARLSSSARISTGLDHARHTAVEAIEHSGKHDPATANSIRPSVKADRGHPRDREQGDDVGTSIRTGIGRNRRRAFPDIGSAASAWLAIRASAACSPSRPSVTVRRRNG